MAKLTVLYLEDDPLDAELVSAVLSEEFTELNLTHVMDQKEFIFGLAEKEYDIILSDYSMPAFDGLSALKLAQEACPNTPFIIISGKIGEEVAVETLKSGATDYVLKHRMGRLNYAVHRALKEAGEQRKRRRAEAALKESNRRYEDLVEKAGIAILMDNEEGKLTYFNTKLMELFGYSADELAQVTLKDLVHPEDLELMMTHQYHRSQWPQSRSEFRGVRKDGTTIFLEADVVEVKEGERRVGTRSYLWDISERKQIEQQLKNYQEHLEDLVAERNAELLAANEKLRQEAIEIKQKDEELRKSRDFLNNVLNGLDDPVIVKDEHSRIVVINDSGCSLLMQPRENLLSQIISELYPDPRAADAHKNDDLVFDHETTTVTEYEIARNNQAQFLSIKKSVFRDSITGKKYLVSYSRDITAHRKLEECIRLSEEKYRNIVELAPDIIVTFDANGIITSCNSAAIALVNLNREELIGRHFTSAPIVPIDDLDKYRDLFNSSMHGNVPRPFECHWNIKEGIVRHGEAHISIVKTNDKISMVHLFIRDITDSKRAEIALRESEERYRNLYEQNPTMYFTVAPDGVILSVNPFGAEQLGYRRDQLVGQSVLDIFHPDDRRDISTQLEKCVKNPFRIHNWEFRKLHRDGSVIWVKETARFVENFDKKFFLIVCEDITDQVKAQQEKDKLVSRLAKAEKLAVLGQFTAAISHEINNPLDIIMTELYPLQKFARKYPEINEQAVKIKQQVMRLTMIIKDLLNYSRPQRLKFEPVDINRIIHDTVDSLSNYLTDSITLKIDLAPDLPLVEGDTLGLEIVLKNIITNAIESVTQPGQITITSCPAGEDDCKIEISDNGEGIAEEDLPRIFEPFYSSKLKSGGTGLGLTISKEIIHLHHGQIQISSQVQHGTTVTIHLPILHRF